MKLTEEHEQLRDTLVKFIDREINPAVAPSGVNLAPEEGAPFFGEGGFMPGSFMPDIIVLLTDGANSRGPLPLDAARQAADRQVRVYTIGFGTTEIPEMVCTRQQLGSDIFGFGSGRGFGSGGFGSFGGGFGRGFGGGPAGFRRFLVIDEATLQGVADITGGSYYRAENADQLLDFFQNVPTEITLQTESLEISVLFVILGALFTALAIALSMLWNRFP